MAPLGRFSEHDVDLDTWVRRLPVPRGGSCRGRSCSKPSERSSHSMSGWESDGHQKRIEESNRKLPKKIDQGKGPNVPVRLPNGEKRGLLPERQYGDVENREPAEHGLRHLREPGSAGI